MKKILVFSAALAALSLTSCNKEDAPAMQNNVQNEICVVNVASTKGYVTGADFYDTPYDKIHKTDPETTARKMLLSAYLSQPQDSKADPADYFVGKEFAKGGPDDNFWHADPKVFWPLGGTLDFLAISVEEDFAKRDVTWDDSNASQEVSIDVRDTYTQDDILYSGYTGKKVSDSGVNGDVALKFGHAQAWIEFKLEADVADVMFIKEIIIEDLYKSGELTITRGTSTGDNNGVGAEAVWSFRGQVPDSYAMDNTFGVDTLTTTAQYMDMLIPEQVQTEFVIYYTLGSDSQVLTYRYSLSGSTEKWEMGKKYIYEINFDLNEITVSPSVSTFEGVNIAALDVE